MVDCGLRLVKTVCFAALLAFVAGGILIQTEASTSVKKKSSTKRKASKSKKPSPPGWRATQQVPTPERYRRIQQALVEKGYLTGPPNGVWGPESMEAMKRFQKDQNLEPSGKLTSLSLIALGLGPRQDFNNREGQPFDAGTRTNK